jgi:hypothetical protein
MKVEYESGSSRLRQVGKIRNSSLGEKARLGDLFVRTVTLFRISIFEFPIFGQKGVK